MIFSKFLRASLTYSAILCSILISYVKIRINNIYNRKLTLECRKKQNIKIFVKVLSYFFDLLYWIKFEFEGDNFDFTKNQVILLGNHISYMDVFIYAHLFNKKFINYDKLYYISIDIIKKIPIFGYLIENTNSLTIKVIRDKEEHSFNKEIIQLYKKTQDCLEKGNSILIFPEGRINENPKIMKKINNGAFNISKKSNVPIKIISKKGTEKIWPKGGHPTGSGTIKIKIFDQIHYFEDVNQYQNEVRNTIETFVRVKYKYYNLALYKIIMSFKYSKTEHIMTNFNRLNEEDDFICKKIIRNWTIYDFYNDFIFCISCKNR